MRKNNNLSAVQTQRRIGALVVLFVTGFILGIRAHSAESTLRTDNPYTENITELEEVEFRYDSAIQRSYFLAIEPRYKKVLKKQLEDRRSQLLWRMRFEGQSLETATNIQSQAVGTTGRVNFDYKLLDDVTFSTKVNLRLRSGRSQAIFGDLEPDSGFYPREAKVSWKPMGSEIVTLDAGQIHQRWHNNSQFIGNLGFPGLKQEFEFDFWNKRIELAVIGQQLIPSSYTLSTRVAEEDALPTLTTESLELFVHTSRNNFIRTRLTHFRYGDLPSPVAFESQRLGNTLLGTQGDYNNAEFAYGFDGFVGMLGFEQKFSDNFAAQIIYDVIVNNAAPSSRGEAQKITGALAYDTGRWIVSGHYDQFFTESDAVPAVYNSFFRGNTNRQGFQVGIGLESKDWGVIFRGSYSKADLLNRDIPFAGQGGLQPDDLETFWLRVETMYDFI